MVTFDFLLSFIRLTFSEDPWGVAAKCSEQVTVQSRVGCMEMAGSELGLKP